MTTPLVSPAGIELALPPDIHDLIDNSLMRANDMVGNATDKFYVAGHPDLVVRHSSVAWPDDEQLALDSLVAITAQGISVLPHKLVEHESSEFAYVVTKKVDGIDLNDALADNPSQEFLGGVDSMWASFVEAANQSREACTVMPADVTGSNQYMLGTLDIDPVQRIRLVDLPSLCTDLSSDFDYTSELVTVANSVAEIEIITHKRLEGARAAILGALGEIVPKDEYVERLVRATHYVLENLISLWPSDPDEMDAILAAK